MRPSTQSVEIQSLQASQTAVSFGKPRSNQEYYPSSKHMFIDSSIAKRQKLTCVECDHSVFQIDVKREEEILQELFSSFECYKHSNQSQ